ncbi:hypothetical protein [Neisseria dumasiana]|uniref:hypothetical protein n=1 Tax=Neisseria dumasiana TaxID=1931275 RepID=UPI000F79BE5B|nr:hypothetical protein [Neisseria dumasiana]UOO84022.1 hypothetical protein LVJ88_10110 [Neisseria dumasiana]
MKDLELVVGGRMGAARYDEVSKAASVAGQGRAGWGGLAGNLASPYNRRPIFEIEHGLTGPNSNNKAGTDY